MLRTPNYGQTALTRARRKILFTSGQTAGANTPLTLTAGDRLVFYMVKNNTSSNWLQANPDSVNRIGRVLGSQFVFDNLIGDDDDNLDDLVLQIEWD
ncbi:MAG: hypothetical protein QNJ47_12495 [Nostocaceae cyanobacterium]|nr:hypothetical protein [Nostocaceae cyanobacterium]